MKKIFISLLTMVFSLNMFAQIQYIAGADIKLQGNTSMYYKTVTIAALQNDNPAQYNAEMYEGSFSSAKVAIFVAANSKKYGIFAANDLLGTAIGFKGYTDTEYTMTISNVKGTQTLTMFDAVENKYFDLTEGATYTFTAAANATVADRFSIKAKPAEPAICHQYGNLIITGHQGAKVKVLDMADQVAIAEQTLPTDDEVISLSSLTKGEMYQVIVDEGTPMLIRIQ